ncbi:sugar ABC transporter substrate-binding protein [Treponema primitia]|uniref:sugar ABC transporter substrate-binding protein n=1 Tax=Treponema primitia TaxID=88058 RepID=UPI00025551C3|nr:substrate-binding domain-containing protein [Treponema primitia]
MKKVLGVLAAAVLAIVLVTGCSKKQAPQDEKTIKIGYTVLSLADAYFSDFFREFEAICKNRGWQLTAVDCRMDSGTQITQIENFITNGMTVIIAQPQDPNALADTVAAAHEKGVIMMGHGIAYPTADVNMYDDNLACGKAVGIAAAKWAREVYGDVEVEAGMFDWQYIKEGRDRNDGILEGLKESNSKIKIVATGMGIDITSGMNFAENMLQANPNIKMFLGITDGGALGACELLESRGVDPEKYAVFGIDATEEALAKIDGNTPFKMTVSKGVPRQNAEMVEEIVDKLISGTYEKVYLTPTITVDKTNYKEFM